VVRGINGTTERYRVEYAEQIKLLNEAEVRVRKALKLCERTCEPVHASCPNEVVVGTESSHIGIMGVRCEDPTDVVWCEAVEMEDVNMFGNHCATRWFCGQPAVGDGADE
jgi:hypothetical protein